VQLFHGFLHHKASVYVSLGEIKSRFVKKVVKGRKKCWRVSEGKRGGLGLLASAGCYWIQRKNVVRKERKLMHRQEEMLNGLNASTRESFEMSCVEEK
jgi:hypothetical protein